MNTQAAPQKLAYAVIGAGYGDEGKGVTTDYLAVQRGGGSALVVRFNGGAQAGHTVVAPDGRRHVYSHVTSAAMSSIPGFLSRFFVCNPLLYVKECAQLQQKGTVPRLHVDMRAPVTTPYDMMINQIAEEARGSARHGSCGMGFGETLERHAQDGLSLTYADLVNVRALQEKLDAIRRDWLVRRLTMLGVERIPQTWQERIAAKPIAAKFMDDCAFFLKTTQPEDERFLAAWTGTVVFEGAQGLLLDQTRGQFPHVTRSNTGLKNVLELSREAGITALRAVYVTRAYATRHGAGPLAHELGKPPTAAVADETNIANPWQGALRFGRLDADILSQAITADVADAQSRAVKISHGLSVTCLDQMDTAVHFMEKGALCGIDNAAFGAHLLSRTGGAFLLEGRGPSRIHMSFKKDADG